MAESLQPSRSGGRQPGAGRPPGARSTEPSDLAARLVAARPETTQKALAAELGISEQTLGNYLRDGIAPKRGAVRLLLERSVRTAEAKEQNPT